MPRRRYLPLATTALAVLLAGACADSETAAPSTNPLVRADVSDASSAPIAQLVVHRDPDCPCCGGWQEVLRSAGFELTEHHHDDMAEVKDRFGIPVDQASCHTTEVEGYFAEGHVPAQAILDLLETRPDIDGIALAGMPPGSPGMPGQQTGPFVVNVIVDGEVAGELGRY